MGKTIEITDETAALVARQSAAAGMSEAELVAHWAHAADAGADALRAAILLGAQQADRGEFSDQTVEEIFDEVLADYDRENGASVPATCGNS